MCNTLFCCTPAVGKALSLYWCLEPCFALVLRLSGVFVSQHQHVHLAYVVSEALMVLYVFFRCLLINTVTLPPSFIQVHIILSYRVQWFHQTQAMLSAYWLAIEKKNGMMACISYCLHWDRLFENLEDLVPLRSYLLVMCYSPLKLFKMNWQRKAEPQSLTDWLRVWLSLYTATCLWVGVESKK